MIRQLNLRNLFFTAAFTSAIAPRDILENTQDHLIREDHSPFYNVIDVSPSPVPTLWKNSETNCNLLASVKKVPAPVTTGQHLNTRPLKAGFSLDELWANSARNWGLLIAMLAAPFLFGYGILRKIGKEEMENRFGKESLSEAKKNIPETFRVLFEQNEGINRTEIDRLMQDEKFFKKQNELANAHFYGSFWNMNFIEGLLEFSFPSYKSSLIKSHALRNFFSFINSFHEDYKTLLGVAQKQTQLDLDKNKKIAIDGIKKEIQNLREKNKEVTDPIWINFIDGLIYFESRAIKMIEAIELA